MIRKRLSLGLTLFLIIFVSVPFAQSPSTVRSESNDHLQEQFNLGDNTIDNLNNTNNVATSVTKTAEDISNNSKSDKDITQPQPTTQSLTINKKQSQEQYKGPDPSSTNPKQENIVLPDSTISDGDKAKKATNEETIKKRNQPNVFTTATLNTIKRAIGGNSDLPAILMGLVVAYLTILISVAIAIFSEKKEFETLDRNVILDHIIKAKRLLFYLGLTFFPLLFWNGSIIYVRLLGIILWIIGVICITRILINSYHWMKGNKFRLRFGYLKRLQNKQDMEEAWRSVWQTENINHQNELEFFDIFHSTIDRLLKNNDNDTIISLKLFGDFDNFLIIRSTGFLTWSGKTLNKLLNWHFEVWQKEHEYLYPDKNITKWSLYNQLSMTTDSIFKQAIILTLKEQRTYSFFNTLRKHVKKYEKATVSNRSYSDFLFDTFYKAFFQNIYDAPERFDIWEHYFPIEWKITKGNLQNPENQISKISLRKFMEWAGPKIWEGKNEKDFALDDVSRNIFPEVDPIMWALILIFIYSSNGDNRMRSIIESQWNFGFLGRMKVSFDSQKQDVENGFEDDVLNTFALSVYLFKGQFSEKKLNRYLRSLKELSYPDEAKEERKRLRLFNLFTKMLDFVKTYEESSSPQPI